MSKTSLVSLAVILVLVGAAAGYFWMPLSKTIAQIDMPFLESEPDLPAILNQLKSQIPKEDFLRYRAEHFGILRGLDVDAPKDPSQRAKAVEQMDKQVRDIESGAASEQKELLDTNWSAIGPAPIISGGSRFSGRVIAIAVHPTNPNTVYVGAAQGGLYRSTDGGTNWTSLMDGAQSLAIGAIAFAPSDPETIYIGTGEHNFSADSFFGVGVYRINNASTTATLSGPFNKNAGNSDIFTGRGISEIIVHPTDPNTIFVSSTSGIGGIGGVPNNVLPSRGLYRSTNANSGAPIFAKLTGLAGGADASVRDLAIDPANADILVAGVVAAGTVGGIYRSADALAATPTFSQRQVFDSTSTSELTSEFASIHPIGATDATFYAAVGNLGGRVLRSTNGGIDWVQQIDNNFCTPQCFYDIAIAVDPTNADKLFLGGSPTLVAGVSTTGGTSFTSTGGGVHVDTHAFAVAASDPTVVYLGTDGGIYRSSNGGTSWSHLNNDQFFATQFMSVAVHPRDPNYTIGGTQDNGTNAFNPAGTAWNRVDGGDGGFTVIDQNAVDTTIVRMYHTYFSQLNNLVGYATRAVGGSGSGGWAFRGCQGTTPANGINCADSSVLFYAPLERGPGNPNTIYYGTDRLYRSDSLGVTHTVVSQAPITNAVAISAIGISPTDDNRRLVGLRSGTLMGTGTGSSTLIDLDPTNAVQNSYISRIAIDPSDHNIAYVTISAFGVNNVFKTTNLNNLNSSTAPTWTLATGTGGNTIPQVPVNAIVVDPRNSQNVYAGTDIGVYASVDGGANWSPFGTGLPRVAVFGMAIAPGNPRRLRIATHGKGMYHVDIEEKRTEFNYDADIKSDISVFRPSTGDWWILEPGGGYRNENWGIATDRLAPADYDGDGATDLAVFRPDDGNWYVINSETQTMTTFNWGIASDVIVPGDYGGDGEADLAIYRPSTGDWWINDSESGVRVVNWGVSTDRPIPADFDGDGTIDITAYRPAEGNWYVINSETQTMSTVNWGIADDQLVPADYNGDGRADFAVWRPSEGNWYRRDSDGQFHTTNWGIATDKPTPGDYDGDGDTDLCVFRPATGEWWIFGSPSPQQFGISTDLPTPNAFVR